MKNSRRDGNDGYVLIHETNGIMCKVNSYGTKKEAERMMRDLATKDFNNNIISVYKLYYLGNVIELTYALPSTTLEKIIKQL